MSRLSLPAGIALAALGLAFVHPAQAQTSIQFKGQGTALLSTQSAGVIAAANYNVLGGSTGTNAALVNSAGGSTLITATYSAAGTYFSHAGDSSTVGSGTANNTLMSGYLDSNSTVGPTVTISGLDPTKSYNVYAYFNTDHTSSGQSGVSGRIASYTIGSTTFFAQLQPGLTFASTGFTAATATSQASAVIANYALFSNVTGSSFTLSSTPLSSTDGFPRSPIDGLQIVTNNSASAAPEPSQFAGLAFTVLGLAALTLKARQRRSDAAQV